LVRAVAGLHVKSVLDVGCGSGENLRALSAEGKYDLTGIDLSETALKIAREKVPDAAFHSLDVQTTKLPTRFDLVISMQVIEHIPDDLAALRNMALMSKKYVMVATMQGQMRKSESQIGHLRNYTREGLLNSIRETGLKPIKVEEWGFPFYSPLYRTAAEFLPGGPPSGPIGPLGRLAAKALYGLYKINLPNRGDVITVLAEAN
jgi:SAM-dependent methyltransferase